MSLRTNKTNAALMACVFWSTLSAASHDARGEQLDPMRREIDDINRESSSIVRTEYAKKLSEFIKNDTRGDIEDRDIDILAGMMQDKDDSVRYWIAISLGFIGERAQRSVPSLTRALRDRACDHSSKTSASAIRLAFKRMGIAPPDIDCDR